MEVTKQSMGLFRADFNKALADLEMKYGVKISLGTIKGDKFGFSGKVTVSNVDDNAATEEDEFKRNLTPALRRRGITANWYGRTVRIEGSEYTVCGLNPHNTKYPCLIKDAEGKVYKTTISMAYGNLNYGD